MTVTDVHTSVKPKTKGCERLQLPRRKPREHDKGRAMLRLLSGALQPLFRSSTFFVQSLASHSAQEPLRRGSSKALVLCKMCIMRMATIRWRNGSNSSTKRCLPADCVPASMTFQHLSASDNLISPDVRKNLSRSGLMSLYHFFTHNELDEDASVGL